MLLNFLQCTCLSLTTKNYLPQMSVSVPELDTSQLFFITIPLKNLFIHLFLIVMLPHVILIPQIYCICAFILCIFVLYTSKS